MGLLMIAGKIFERGTTRCSLALSLSLRFSFCISGG